jgi:hypothetical protein
MKSPYVRNCCMAAAFCFFSMSASAQYGAPPADSGNGKGAGSPAATPRTSDGHPDLSGFWNNGSGTFVDKTADGSIDLRIGARPDPNKAATPQTPRPAPSLPIYQPWAVQKIKEINAVSYGPTNRNDPQLSCLPLGIPRQWTPLQIVQTPGQVVILYETLVGQAFRVIPTDGRPHPKDLDPTFYGDSVGHWEGNTLVVDVIGFNDKTWLGGGEGKPGEQLGWFHSEDMRVVERYTREGNTLTYEATVEDPKVLTKPWTISPRRVKLADSTDRIMEAPPCIDHDKEHVVTGNENH